MMFLVAIIAAGCWTTTKVIDTLAEDAAWEVLPKATLGALVILLAGAVWRGSRVEPEKKGMIWLGVATAIAFAAYAIWLLLPDVRS